jgi:hypothetical protein
LPWGLDGTSVFNLEMLNKAVPWARKTLTELLSSTGNSIEGVPLQLEPPKPDDEEVGFSSDLETSGRQPSSSSSTARPRPPAENKTRNGRLPASNAQQRVGNFSNDSGTDCFGNAGLSLMAVDDWLVAWVAKTVYEIVLIAMVKVLILHLFS